MSFTSLIDAQTQAVQGVITRRSLDEALASAQTPTEISNIKNQIRSTQYLLNQANNYIVANGFLALVYSPDIFTTDGYIKTQWSNENQIPNTFQYSINQLTPLSVEQVIEINNQLSTNLQSLITSTEILLNESKNKLQVSQSLPIGTVNRDVLISESQSSIYTLTNRLQDLINQKNGLNDNFVIPSTEVNNKNSFGDSIRKALRETLNSKPGYVEQPGDIEAAISMRRKALDLFYTASSDLDKKVALERLNRVYESLSPDVPLVRNLMPDTELFLTTKIAQIDSYNQELKPKADVLAAAQLAYANARDLGDQGLIDSTKLAYETANTDYESTLYNIQKIYDAILGYQNSFGQSAMFPGSITVQQRLPDPAFNEGVDSNGKPTGYPLIYDTVNKEYVSQKDAKADPGRYLEGTYTNRPASAIQTDAEKTSAILSQQYRETAKAEADFTYKRETEQLFYQNTNRQNSIESSQKDLAKVDKDWEAKKSEAFINNKPITNEEFLKYQQQRQTITENIAKDQAVIDTNSATIAQAALKRDEASDPTTTWQSVQKGVETYVDGTNRTVQSNSNLGTTTNNAQDLASKYYDTKAETSIAEKQLVSAQNLTSKSNDDIVNSLILQGYPAEQAKNWNKKDSEGFLIIPPDKIDPTLKAAYDANKSKETNAQTNLTNAQQNEKLAADKVQSIIDKAGSSDDAKRALENLGINKNDIEKSIVAGSPSLQATNRLAEVNKLQNERDANVKKLSNESTVLNEEMASLKEQLKGEKDPEKQKELQKQIDEKQKELDKNSQDLEHAIAAADSSQVSKDVMAAESKTLTEKAEMANTGFEGLNNGAPFYMQFPTLNSIADFKLRNGVDPYGEKSTDEIARDAVIFKIFETVPGVAQSTEVKLQNGAKYIKNVPTKTNLNTLGSFTIYPSHNDGKGDWLGQKHHHNWVHGEQDAVAKVFNTISEFVSTGESILKLADAGLNSLQRGEFKGSGSTGNVYNRKVDVLDYYQSSNAEPINITFNLFTRNNFLNDVFRPIMFLTALGYPKRAMTGDFGKLLDKVIKGASQEAGKSDKGYAKFIEEQLNKLASLGLGDKFEDIERQLAEFGGLGPYRYYVSKRPEYMTIRHASGLFYYPIAYIESFSYNFKGPWYNYNGEQLSSTKDLDSLISTKIIQMAPPPDKTFKEKLNATFTDLGNNIKDTFRPPPKKVPRPTPPEKRVTGEVGGLLQLSDSDIKFIRSKGLPFAYPSWAECTITVKNATPFFRDDFMAMFYQSQQGGESLVTLTQEMTNQTSFASGGRKARSNMVDDAYTKKTQPK